MYSRLLFIFAALFSLNSLADSMPLTQSEIVRQVVKRAPALKSKEAALNETRAVTRRYKGALFPTVTAKASATSREDTATLATSSAGSGNRSVEDYQAYLEAKQPLYTGGAAIGALQLQKKKEAVAYLEWLDEKQNTIQSALESYYSVRENTELLAAAKENEQILSDYEKILQRYTKIGRARKTDLLQARVNLLSAQAETQQVKSALVTNEQKLREWLGLEDVPDVDKAPQALEKIVYPDVSTAVKSSLSANPGLLLASQNLEKTKYEKDVELAGDMPTLNLTGKIGYQSPDQPNLFKNTSEMNSVSLNLEIPLFSGLSSVARRRELAERKMSRERTLETTRLRVDGHVRSLIEELRNHEQRSALSKEASEQARAALRAGNADYNQGLISSQDLVSLQRTRFESEKLRIRSHYDFARALLALRKEMGIDLETTYAKK